MANPLYIDLGFSKTDIANVSKLYGVWVGIVGAFAGGLALTRLGLWTTLLVGAAIAAGSNLMFAWLAAAGARLDLLTLTISIDNFAGGFAGSALIAYMSGLTSPAFAATQYALLSSLYALPGKFIGGFSGAVVDTYGYPALFTGTALIGIPLIVLCFVVQARHDGGRGASHRGRARRRSGRSRRLAILKQGSSGRRQRKIAISSSGFLPMAGTRQPGAGRPTTRRIIAFSLSGRPQISLRKPIGAGVWVRVASPA